LPLPGAPRMARASPSVLSAERAQTGLLSAVRCDADLDEDVLEVDVESALCAQATDVEAPVVEQYPPEIATPVAADEVEEACPGGAREEPRAFSQPLDDIRLEVAPDLLENAADHEQRLIGEEDQRRSARVPLGPGRQRAVHRRGDPAADHWKLAEQQDQRRPARRGDRGQRGLRRLRDRRGLIGGRRRRGLGCCHGDRQRTALRSAPSSLRRSKRTALSPPAAPHGGAVPPARLR
jgi:hypothetical protein